MKSKLFTVLTLPLMALVLASCAGNAKKELTPTEKKAKLYFNQGTRDLVAKDYTKALTNLLEAASLAPENSDVHNNLGMAYYFKKSNQRAITHIKKAIALNPKNTDAKLNLATIYMASDLTSQAETLYLQILEDLTYEGQHRTHYNLGLIELAKKNNIQAAKRFQMALQVSPEYCPAHFKLAEISYNAHKYAKAFDQYREAGMGTCYNNPEPLHGQIESLIKLGRYPEAISKLKDMQERFAMTKYESYARRTIMKVKAMQAKGEDNTQSFSRNIGGEIKAVGF